MKQAHPISDEKWHWLNKTFHWVMAVFIFTALILGLSFQFIDNDSLRLKVMLAHKSIGITILVMALVRLFWRLHVIAPVHENHWRIERIAATAVHVVLYGLMIAIPLSGWLMSNYAGYSVHWFNLVEAPVLVSENKDIASTISEIHELMAWVLLGLLALHIAGALKHHVLDKDNTLRGMAGQRAGRTLGIVAACVAIGVWLSFPNPLQKIEVGKESTDQTALSDSDAGTKSSLLGTPWKTQSGTLSFAFTLSDGPVSGRFDDFTSRLHFSDDIPVGFDVDINLHSVNTGDKQRDELLRSGPWFGTFPKAQYHARKFVYDTDAGTWTAKGILTIKGISLPTPFTFKLMSSSASTHAMLLHGEAKINRKHFNIGIGEWSSPDIVAHDVSVVVGLVLNKPQ